MLLHAFDCKAFLLIRIKFLYHFFLGFISKFIESHRVMIQGNSGLKPKEGEWTSKPWEWPVNMKGQWFSAGEELRIYLLGNPIIWWGNLVFLAVFIAVYVFHSFKGQRGDKMATENTLDAASGASSERALVACGWLFLGWCMHYIPFYTMGRVLYYHHYFPALLFSSMLSGVIVDYIIRKFFKFIFCLYKSKKSVTYSHNRKFLSFI